MTVLLNQYSAARSRAGSQALAKAREASTMKQHLDAIEKRIVPQQPKAATVTRFAVIRKTDDEQRLVYGYASTVNPDSQGETVTKAAMENAITEFMKFANLREMHQPSAVGVVESADVDDKGIYITAKVVDDDAWKKVKAGVYKGFSIGGKSVSKVDGVIKAMRLTEISLVDRPANPECTVELWKADRPTASLGDLLRARAQQQAQSRPQVDRPTVQDVRLDGDWANHSPFVVSRRNAR